MALLVGIRKRGYSNRPALAGCLKASANMSTFKCLSANEGIRRILHQEAVTAFDARIYERTQYIVKFCPRPSLYVKTSAPRRPACTSVAEWGLDSQSILHVTEPDSKQTNKQ
jgi:hypothetical protein